METLRHNGILVVQPTEPRGLAIVARGKRIVLNQLQEEMAVAWVKKLGTPYVEDPVFAENFMNDFSKALGINPPLRVDEVDFSEVIRVVEAERAAKEAMTKEEKKAARERRKEERERLKERYGYAIVDGQRMELATYMTEPSGIFMGRGQHPLRGRWKQGARHEDITLNLDPDAEIPEGNWGEIVWAPDCMWIAKWTDKLTGKTKYIWLHDSTPIKQEREAEKFDKALQLSPKMQLIRNHIMNGLHSDNPKTREVAAACYLIDRLSLRVGDEKDPDEADTVGATTLRVEHLTFKKNSIVFDFLGKDSVPWHKELEMPPDVMQVFRELYENAVERVRSFETRKSKETRADPKKIAQIFPRIRSSHVNKFLSKVVPGLTAKMFRTHHATVTMRDELAKSRVKKTAPDFMKKAAFKRANLEVARVMNHTKQAPKGWPKTEERYRLRIKKAEERIKKAEARLSEAKKKLAARRKKEKEQLQRKKAAIEKQQALVEKYKQAVDAKRQQRDRAKAAWDRAREQRRKIRGSRRKGSRTKKERLEEAQVRVERAKARLERAEAALVNARRRYDASKQQLAKKKAALAAFKEKSAERIARAERAVKRAKERVKKARLAKQKVETDFALAKACRTWNLGTSLKSYIHPKIVYNWCQKVEYDWRKVYSKVLQRKFAWVESI
ncbi:MAG: DNA topoisomerase I [Candidatus Thorarchaeota archaeon]|nr:MAG: DNA topoisomerase I [Candidatus Thorarchaeota archaeon]